MSFFNLEKVSPTANARRFKSKAPSASGILSSNGCTVFTSVTSNESDVVGFSSSVESRTILGKLESVPSVPGCSKILYESRRYVWTPAMYLLKNDPFDCADIKPQVVSSETLEYR